MSALSGAQHLASSGRTSFPVDKALHRDAYRVLGYRQCGERAVRVDILERLADLIRPALAWRESSPGEKPTGAFDGRGFVVTQAMTSLTGSAGEDFASILRALGYRMDKRPPLPPKPAPEVVVETVPPRRRRSRRAPRRRQRQRQRRRRKKSPPKCLLPASPRVSIVAAQCHAGGRRDRRACGRGRAPRSRACRDHAGGSRDRGRASGTGGASRRSAPPKLRPSPPPRAKPPVKALPQKPLPRKPLLRSRSREASPNAGRAELIEVWRPGGRSEERRPHHDRNRQRHHARPAGGRASRQRRRRRGRAARAASSPRPPQQRFP